MAHSHHMHREHQVSHRRVHHILKEEPHGAKEHSKSHAFSKVTSKTAAEKHDGFVAGSKQMKRYARGGKVSKSKGKGGHHTNIAIVVPPHGGAPAGGPIPGPGGPPPGGAPMMKPPMPPPGGPPMGGPPGMPPPGMPPGMPMRKHGGRVKRRADGGGTKMAGDVVNFPISMKESDTRRIKGMQSPPPLSPAPKPLLGPGAASARGGVIDGESTKANIGKWSKRASKNSYAKGGFVKPKVIDRAGATTGVGRLEAAEHMKRKGK